MSGRRWLRHANNFRVFKLYEKSDLRGELVLLEGRRVQLLEDIPPARFCIAMLNDLLKRAEFPYP